MTPRRTTKPAELPERSLPNNLEAERSILGAILIDNKTLDIATTVIRADDFFRDAHKRVFKAIQTLALQKARIDLVTLKDTLAKSGELDECGGPSYISAFVDGVPRSSNVEHYAEIVREKATLRAIIFAANDMMAAAYDAAESAVKVLADADRQIVDLQTAGRDRRLTDLRGAHARIMSDLDYRVAHRGELLGRPTGFTSVDETTLGWCGGDLVVIAARPSIGKTSFVLNSIVASAAAGARVAMFSLEMKRKQLENRMLSSLSEVPLTRIITGYLSEHDYKKLSEVIGTLSDLPIFIDDRASQTVWDIRSAVRRMRAEVGLDLIVIDYVQLMAGSLDRRGATRNDEVTDISRRLKGLADELDVPLLLLSQLSRANEKRNDPRPRLSDLRESGALEQDADLVCFLHRKNHREGGATEFIIEKQRNGPTGTMMLTLDRDIVKFSALSEEEAAAVAPAEPAQAALEHVGERQKRKRRTKRQQSADPD